MKIFNTPPTPVTKLYGYGEVIIALNTLTQTHAFKVLDETLNPTTPKVRSFAVKTDIPEVSLAMELEAHELTRGVAAHNETKDMIGLGNVDNFPSATVDNIFNNDNDLFVTPPCIRAAMGSDSVLFNEENYLAKGSLPVASGQDYLFDVPNLSSLNNENSDAFYALDNHYFEGVGKIILNHDRLVIIPNEFVKPGTPDFGKFGFSYVSTALSNSPKLNFNQDRLSVPYLPTLGFNNEGFGYGSGNLIPQNHLESEITNFKPTKVNDYSSHLFIDATKDNVAYGITESLNNGTLKLIVKAYNLDPVNKTYDAGPGVPAIFRSFNGVENIPSLSDGIIIPIEKLLVIPTGVSIEVLPVDNKVPVNASLAWEVPGKTLISLWQYKAIATGLNGNKVNLIIKVGLRFTQKADGSVEVAHLIQQSKATINPDLTIVSNNVIFYENDFINSPFHPAIHSGVFSPFGGHYTAFANLGGTEITVKYFKHGVSNIVDFINNFHNLPKITDTLIMHIPRFSYRYLGYNFSRFIPLTKNSFLVTSQNNYGQYRQREFEWPDGLLCGINAQDEVVLPTPEVVKSVDYRLPFGIISLMGNNTGNQTVENTALVLCKENDYVGYEDMRFNEDSFIQGKRVELNSMSKFFLTAKMNGEFKQELIDHFKPTTHFELIGDQGEYGYRVYLIKTLDSYEAFVIFTDNLSGAALYHCDCDCDPTGLINLTQITKLTSCFTPKYLTDFVRGDIECYDIFTHYDLGICSVGEDSTLLFNNVLGEFGGDIFMGVTSWVPGKKFSSSLPTIYKNNLQMVSHPKEVYGLHLRGQVSSSIKLPGTGFLMAATGLDNHKKPSEYDRDVPGLLNFNMPVFNAVGAYQKDIETYFNSIPGMVTLPGSIRVLLNGEFHCLGYDRQINVQRYSFDPVFISSKYNKFGLIQSNMGGIIYISLQNGRPKIMISQTIRPISNYEVLYGVAVFDESNRVVIKLYDNYTIVDGIEVI